MPMSDSAFQNLWIATMRPWIDAALAPQKLIQSINSGWSFGNIIVNEQNSSAPQAERTILAQESYGRQIGKLLDAVDALVKLQPNAGKGVEPFDEVKELKDRIDRIKCDGALGRIRQLGGDLQLLALSSDEKDRAAYHASIEALRALLVDVPEGA